MFSQKTKHTLAYVFLISFVLLKISGLHAFAHHSQDDIRNCVICHLTSRDNSTPVISFDNHVEIGIFRTLVFPRVVNHYISLTSERPEVCELFNRPPPLYTVA